MLSRTSFLARIARSHAASIRPFSSTTSVLKWTGRPADEHTAREPDDHNVQYDATKEGKTEKAKGTASNASATSETGGADETKKAKSDRPEAPGGPVLGMNDERGGAHKAGEPGSEDEKKDEATGKGYGKKNAAADAGTIALADIFTGGDLF